MAIKACDMHRKWLLTIWVTIQNYTTYFICEAIFLMSIRLWSLGNDIVVDSDKYNYRSTLIAHPVKSRHKTNKTQNISHLYRKRTIFPMDFFVSLVTNLRFFVLLWFFTGCAKCWNLKAKEMHYIVSSVKRLNFPRYVDDIPVKS